MKFTKAIVVRMMVLNIVIKAGIQIEFCDSWYFFLIVTRTPYKSILFIFSFIPCLVDGITELLDLFIAKPES